MDDRLIELFSQAIWSVGSNSDDFTVDDIKIMRAYIAEGFYSFCDKNRNRTSKKSDYDWMLAQAKKFGVNNVRAVNR